jgi:hypothetical protein
VDLSSIVSSPARILNRSLVPFTPQSGTRYLLEVGTDAMGITVHEAGVVVRCTL